MNVAIILCMKYVEFALVRILAVLLVKCGYVCIRITYFPMMRVPCVSIVIVAYGGRARVCVGRSLPPYRPAAGSVRRHTWVPAKPGACFADYYDGLTSHAFPP